MNPKKKRPVLFLLLFSGAILFVFLLMQPLEIHLARKLIAVLFPKGLVATQQRNLLLFIQVVMLLVVIPVYFLTFYFAWKYRADNVKAVYDPHEDENKLSEVLWWGIPIVLVVIISIVTWIKTVELDPYKPLVSEKKPLKIQVVALQWKWLFIYPEEKIATVNFFYFPEKTPLHFEITADAPMNSFWIPQLGGQIYAMPKMRTELHLIANEKGDFRGSSANISGAGFADMHFIATATSEEDFNKWIKEAKNSSLILTMKEYQKLALPNTDLPTTYRLEEENLFDAIIMKYMVPNREQ